MMTRLLLRSGLLAAALAALLVVVGCTTTPQPPQPEDGPRAAISYVYQRVEAASNELRNGGIGVVAVVDGEVLLSGGFGMAAEDVAITGDTVFRVGSITKLFTAIAIMQLVEEGLIELDRPYADYVPTFSIRGGTAHQEITVRHLLTHQSGLQGDVFRDWILGEQDHGFDHEFDHEFDQEYDETAYRTVLPILAEQYPTMPPETMFSYSNAGFALLGILIERVTGQQYSDYVEGAILSPLGMGASGFYPDEFDREQLAMGYPAGRGENEPYVRIRDVPAGSMAASLDDMGRFMQMLMREGAPVLSSATFAEMGRPQNEHVALDGEFSVGLTFWLNNPTGIPDLKLMSHGGDLPPYHTLLVTAPEDGVALFLATNTSGGAEAILDIAVDGIQRVVEAKRGVSYERELIVDQPEQPLTEERLAAFSGYWASPVGLAETTVRRGRLRFALAQGTLTLVHRGEGYLTPEFRLLGIPLFQLYPLYFQALEIDDQQLLGLYQNGLLLGYASKFEPAPIPPVWLERQGTYRVVNATGGDFIDSVELIHHESSDLLTLTIYVEVIGQTMELPLRAVDAQTLRTEGRGRLMGETIIFRREAGQEYLDYSGLELRRE